MSRQLLSVAKTKYDGPKGYAQLYERIASDAEKEGIQGLSSEAVSDVIHFFFKISGGLNDLPHFVPARLPYIGNFRPDRNLRLRRQQYYIEAHKYKERIINAARSFRKLADKMDEEYLEYLDTSTAKLKMTKSAFIKYKGYYRELLQKKYKYQRIRRNWKKRRKKLW